MLGTDGGSDDAMGDLAKMAATPAAPLPAPVEKAEKAAAPAKPAAAPVVVADAAPAVKASSADEDALDPFGSSPPAPQAKAKAPEAALEANDNAVEAMKKAVTKVDKVP